VSKNIDVKKVRACKDLEELQLCESAELFKQHTTEVCKGKVFSMDIAE